MDTEKPIYDQILDLEAIELHKLAMIIESNQGTVLDLNTDCVTCTFENNIFPFELDKNNDIKGFYYYYYDENINVPMYKLEDKNTRLQIERNPLYKRENKYVYKSIKWNIDSDVQDNDIMPLVNKVINSNK